MDSDQKYIEALNRAISAYKDEDKHLKATLERIFPELKEEVDELTWLTNYISEEAYSLSRDIRDDVDRIKLKNLQKSLEWLRKQGEQKSVEWNEEEQQIIKDAACVILACVNTVDTREEEEKLEELANKLQDQVVS